MHHPYLLFPVIFGLGCLSADADNLFSDDKAVMASSNIFDSPADVLAPPSNDAYEPTLLGASPDDYADVQAIDQPFEDGCENDPNAPATSPVLLSLDANPPSEFHDDPPGHDSGPVCEFPRLAACCKDITLRDCVWYSPWKKVCENVDNILCCEQVTFEGLGSNCQRIEGWPTNIWDQILDFLRTPVPVPEIAPGGIWSPTE